MEDATKGGIFIYRLYSNQELKQEASQLKVRAEKVKGLVDNSFSKSGNKKFEKSAGLFFDDCMSSLSVSKEMEFLLQGYVLTLLRKPINRHEEGIIYTSTEVSLLSKLSKRIVELDTESQRKITEVWQREFTARSLALLREEAAQVTLLEGEDKLHLLMMLSPDMTRIYTPGPKYEPKSFGCMFYEYRAILTRLSEERGLVCFKSIVKEGTIFYVSLQPKEKNTSFELVPDESYSSFEKTTPVVVFEGIISLKRDAFCKWILDFGFPKAILACAAIEDPYGNGTSVEDVKNAVAHKEILLYREIFEKEVKSVLLLDHVYCSTIKGEWKQ